MKRGYGLDSVCPKICSISPQSVLDIILILFRGVFGNVQPKNWNSQLLISFTKKGHTSSNPNMRGIGIGPVLSRLYDVVLNNRFISWYKPNTEQAGFRKNQGCLLQIFALLLLIDLSEKLQKELFVGIIDYEKAFDFTNRYLLTKDMIEKGIGKRFLSSFAN